MDELKLNYSEEYVRNAIRAYWMRQIGLVFPIITIDIELVDYH